MSISETAAALEEAIRHMCKSIEGDVVWNDRHLSDITQVWTYEAIRMMLCCLLGKFPWRF